MNYRTIMELAQAFYICSGQQPNELWTHPTTYDYLVAQFQDNARLYSIATEFGNLELKKDVAIMPGVIYLDRDGQQRKP